MSKALLATDDQHQLAHMVLNSLRVVKSKYKTKFGRDLPIPADVVAHKNTVKELWARWNMNIERGEMRSFTEREYDSLAKLAMWTTTKNHEIAGTIPPSETMAEWAICHQAQGAKSIKDLGILS